MKKIVPLQNYSREVQIMAHMIGLNNKRPLCQARPPLLQALPQLLLRCTVRPRL